MLDVKTGAGQKADMPTGEELVARAHAMIPALRARAEEIEKARCVPEDVVKSFIDAGFFKILQPTKWGGYAMDPLVFFKVLQELGRGCSSSAWIMMILGVHQWEFGLMDPRAADEVWGSDDSVLIASSYPPVGRLTKVDGGYRLTGRYPTSSGTDHGEYAFLGAFVMGDNGKPVDRVAVLVSREDYEPIDDWHVFGLAGTGSKSLQVNDAFIPDYRVHSVVKYEPVDGAEPIYKLPFTNIFYSAVSAVIIGFAQGAIDLYVEQMKVRKNTDTGATTSASPYVKDRLGNAVVRVRSCKARMECMVREMLETIERGELISIDDRMHYLLDMARVGRECEEAVMLLFKPMGARGIFLNNPMQRVLRDTIAGANHITQNADDTAGMLGGYLLGEELPAMLFGKT